MKTRRPIAFIVLALSLPTPILLGATPSGGTLTDTSGPLTYVAGPFLAANVTAQAGNGPVCSGPSTCDDYALTVTVPPSYATSYAVRIETKWANATADFDLYVYDSPPVNVVKQSATSADPEVAIIPAVSGSFTVRVVPFNPAGQSFTGTISLVPIPVNPMPPPGIPPRYRIYAGPSGPADSSGEPSIGVDWNPNLGSLKHDQVNTGGVAFFTANNADLRVSFDDCSSPAVDLWEDKTSPFEQPGGLDPIGWVDHFGTSPTPGRVFQSQLAAAAGSITSFSTDDGQTWMQSQGAGQPAGVDHQTIGGGPYNEMAMPPPVHPTYPNAVYYCSQDVATIFCARSDDGGLTFGAGVPVYNLTQCGGLHGHIKVAPDGTVYLPNRSCSVGMGAQGAAVSTDNGLSWAIRTVPGSTPGDTDPSVGIATDGTAYLGYQDGDGHARIAVTHDRGLSWVNVRDAGAQFGIQNSVFPEVVAGDPDRAAFGFLGTPTGGNYQDSTNFTGIWHLYIATTFDGGSTYTTVDATPDDPVQVGSICTGGTTCGGDRNLLDFNDITIDAEGRVLFGFADGCLPPGCTASSPSSASRSAKGTIARQAGGRRLFSAFDPTEPSAPAAPRLLSASRSGAGVDVRWGTPDDGASPITAYKVYRGTVSGMESLLTTLSPDKTGYLDVFADPATAYFYQVAAVNAIGEGPRCREIAVTAVAADPCVPPGITVLTDPTGDATDMLPSHDIQSISIGEPYFPDGSQKVVFTLKMASLTPLPPSTAWRVFFFFPGSTLRWVDMETDAIGTVTYNVNDGVTTVAADDGTNMPDGTIRITVSTSKLGTPVAGQTLGRVYVRIIVGAIVLDNANYPTPNGASSYTLVGNAFCRPNLPPVAAMTAAPTDGCTPLLVNFDGSASYDPDSGDTIASYTFDFGDGTSPVTQASPMASHTYATSGFFQARMKVTETRQSLTSTNTALANIETVDDQAPAVTAPAAVTVTQTVCE